MDARFELRCAWTGATAAAVGLLLGMLFPSGLRYLHRAEGAPVALALNGATSVLGSVLAVTVSVWAGIPMTFAVAGASYFLAALAGPHRWPHAEGEP
jgi:ABC-type amino acid transport system permease subunit